MGTYFVQQGGRSKGPIRWGLNIFLLLITGGLWIFALPWWPRHKFGGGANAAAVSSSVVNIQAPAPTPAAPVVHATITAQKDPLEELRKIKALHDDGILTNAEYESQRSALVAQLQPGSGRSGTAAAVEAPQRRTGSSSPPRSTKPPGWYKDPSGMFDWRWFDGTWTDHVANEGDDNTYSDPVSR